MLRVTECTDALTFLERTRKFLFADETRNNLLVSSALVLAKTGAAAFEKVRLFIVEDEAKQVVGAGIRSAQGRLIFSGNADGACAIQREMEAKQISLRGFYSEDAAADAFVAQSDRLKVGSRQLLMKLGKLVEPKLAPGLFRNSRASDLSTLLSWSREFAIECKLDETPAEAEDLVHRFHEMQHLYVWETDRRPVAMAAFSGAPTRAARISMVYTAPNVRGQGFASLIVHRLSRRLKQNDFSSCLLFADRANPTAVSVYQRLGYEIFGGFTELRLRESLDRASAQRGNDRKLVDASR